MATSDLQILSLLLPKGQVQPGAVVMGFLSVCRGPRGSSHVPASKGARKSVFLRQPQKSPQIPVPVRAGVVQTHAIPNLWEKHFTLTFSALIFIKTSSALGVPSVELPFSDNPLTQFIATHHLSSLSLSLWADSLPGYVMASTILLAFSREDVWGLQCEHRVFLLEESRNQEKFRHLKARHCPSGD